MTKEPIEPIEPTEPTEPIKPTQSDIITEKTSLIKTPWHLWLVGGLALVWNGFGVFDYVATVIRYEPYTSQFPQEFLEYIYSMPQWMFAVWAVAIFTGFFGSLALLLRSRLAVSLFGISLLGAAIWGVVGFMGDTPDEFKNSTLTAGILLIALFLVVYAQKMKQNGVLR